jgi:UDP-N-acetylmuramoylalanine--D-glutamate ligase
MKKAMVYGAGVSGKSVVKLLQLMKWETILVDDNVGASSVEAVSYLDDVELFIKSPGIPYNKLVKEVIKKEIKIVDEVEVAYNYMKETSTTKIIAITGTNGKTTTTSKLADLLNLAGIRSVGAGNIGTPYSEVVMEKEKYEYIVLELSSYQLENLENFKADIALIINLAPDHLDRYDSVEDYYKAKFNIGINQGASDKFLVNIDDPEIVKRITTINSELLKISLDKETDIWVSDSKIYFKDEIVTPTTKFSLKGKHNLQNILFIVGVAKLLGIKNEKIQSFLENTENLEHRMEEFYTYSNGNTKIKFINDSKGTNLESTIKAIGAFEHPILICGGCDKKLELETLIEEINKSVEEVYLIGELAPILEEKLIKSNYSKDKIHNLGTLEKVIEYLARNKKENNEELTILLSPATSSFDQFKNFGVRGEKFKRLVREKFKIDKK